MFSFDHVCRKDTRNVTVELTVNIIPATPPIMEIECADSLLCLVGEGGKLFINPSSRLAVKATCSTKDTSDCSSLSYKWYARPTGKHLLKFPNLNTFCKET